MDPDPFKRRLAIGRVSFERTDPVLELPKFRSYDICEPCLGKSVLEILEKKES
jgi:hypothetical protein